MRIHGMDRTPQFLSQRNDEQWQTQIPHIRNNSVYNQMDSPPADRIGIGRTISIDDIYESNVVPSGYVTFPELISYVITVSSIVSL